MIDDVGLHPIATVQGIGGARSAQLTTLGIRFAEDLLVWPEAHVARFLSRIPGLTYENVLSLYIPQAKFLRLDGVTSQYAEGLAKTGFRTHADLIYRDAGTILKALATVAESGAIPQLPPLELIERWKVAASLSIHFSALIVSVCEADTGTSVVGADVYFIGPGLDETQRVLKRTSDAKGVVFCGILYPTPLKVIVEHDAFTPTSITLDCEPGRTRKLTKKLGKEPSLRAIRDESSGDQLIVTNYDFISSERVELSDFGTAPPFVVADIREDTVLLTSVRRRKWGSRVFVPEVLLPLGRLSPSAQVDDVVEIDEHGMFVPTNKTLTDYRPPHSAARGQRGDS